MGDGGVKLTERQRRFLEALARQEEPISSLRVFAVAFPDAPYRARRDAGATRTLLGLEGRGLVDGRYPPDYSGAGSPRLAWEITDQGRAALASSGSGH